jgi:hypothetical protein
METLIIRTEKEKLSALKTFLEEMNITFEIKKPKVKKEDRPYDPKFVKKILDTENEKTIRVNPAKIWESIL